MLNFSFQSIWIRRWRGVNTIFEIFPQNKSSFEKSWDRAVHPIGPLFLIHLLLGNILLRISITVLELWGGVRSCCYIISWRSGGENFPKILSNRLVENINKIKFIQMRMMHPLNIPHHILTPYIFWQWVSRIQFLWDQ